MDTLTPEAQQIFGATYNKPEELWLKVHIPNAQLIIYPDANHRSQYQYPLRFVRHVADFLSENIGVPQ